MANRITSGDREESRVRLETPRWILALLAVFVAAAVGQTAGIVLAACGVGMVIAISAGFVAFGAMVVLVLTLMNFLDGGR
ncbi:hypothetical protein [Cryptosporangium phraense]|uniref:Uncharacterized protein n=1 Tax=Cryptosporangium phraense TaxID=2593070 RepID=A0A545AGL2_9ACTN|nr:hypothetical protein [Cryptosporangium phraense]TQS40468.1 hypothetical protein FL583_34570 [Cryptosporangium phraense]